MSPEAVALIYGGQSSEHEISLLSAANVYRALRHKVIAIYISRLGSWHYLEEPSFSEADSRGLSILIRPGEKDPLGTKDGPLKIDVVLPILHGANGEDGSLQGLMQILGLPCAGADVAGSAINMDKEIMKRLLSEAGIPTAPFRVYHSLAEALTSGPLGVFPQFVKPCRAGSSVGVSRVLTEEEYEGAVKQAFREDNKILVEEGQSGREVECAVLGNAEPEASTVGEIRVKGGFYDYETKYIKTDGAELDIPARLSDAERLAVQKISLQAYRALLCSGMGRVDSFLLPDGRVLINEINTLPGFTNISMYPALWQASGLKVEDLLDRLLALALERRPA